MFGIPRVARWAVCEWLSSNRAAEFGHVGTPDGNEPSTTQALVQIRVFSSNELAILQKPCAEVIRLTLD